MIEVVHFNKCLDLRPLLDLLLAHTLCDFTWITVNSSYKCMAIGLVTGSIIIVLQYINRRGCKGVAAR